VRHPNAYTYGDSHGNSDSYSYSYSYADTDGNATPNSDTVGDAYGQPNTNADAETHRHTEGDTDAQAASNAAATDTLVSGRPLQSSGGNSRGRPREFPVDWARRGDRSLLAKGKHHAALPNYWLPTC
jgi:hypothetical protein